MRRTPETHALAHRLSTFAHAMRQPIQAIELYAEAAARRADNDESRTILGRIGAAVADARRRLSQLTEEADDLLEPPLRERKPLSAARVLLVGDAGARLAQVERILKPVAGQVESVLGHAATLAKADEPVDLVIEHVGAGNPMLGVAIALAHHGRAAPMVLLDHDEHGAALRQHGVAFLIGDPTADTCIDAATSALEQVGWPAT